MKNLFRSDQATVAPVAQKLLGKFDQLLAETVKENNCNKKELIRLLSGLGCFLSDVQKKSITNENASCLRYIFGKIPFDADVFNLTSDTEALSNFTLLVSQGLPYYSSYIPRLFQPGVLPETDDLQQLLFAIIYDPRRSKSETEDKITKALQEMKIEDDNLPQDAVFVHPELFFYAVSNLTTIKKDDIARITELLLTVHNLHRRQLIQLLLTAAKEGIKIDSKELLVLVNSLIKFDKSLLSVKYNYENNVSFLKYLMVDKQDALNLDDSSTSNQKRYDVQCSTTDKKSNIKLTIFKQENKKSEKLKNSPVPIPCSEIPVDFLKSHDAQELFKEFPYELAMLFGIGFGDSLQAGINHDVEIKSEDSAIFLKTRHLCKFLRNNSIYQIHELSELVSLNAFQEKIREYLSKPNIYLTSALSPFMPPEQFLVSRDNLVSPIFSHKTEANKAIKDIVQKDGPSDFFKNYLNGILQKMIDFRQNSPLQQGLESNNSAESSPSQQGLEKEPTVKVTSSNINASQAHTSSNASPESPNINFEINKGFFKILKGIANTALASDTALASEEVNVYKFWDPEKIPNAVGQLFESLKVNHLKITIKTPLGIVDVASYIIKNNIFQQQLANFLSFYVRFINQMEVLDYLQRNLEQDKLKKLKAHGVLVESSVLAQHMHDGCFSHFEITRDNYQKYLFTKECLTKLQAALLEIADLSAFSFVQKKPLELFFKFSNKPYGAKAIFLAWSLKSADKSLELRTDQKEQPMVAGFICYLESLLPNIHRFQKSKNTTSIEYFQRLEALLLLAHNPKIGLDKINALNIDEKSLPKLLNLATRYKQSCIDGLHQDTWFESCVSDLRDKKYNDFDVKLQLIIQGKENKDFNKGITQLLSNPIILSAFQAGDATFITKNISEVLLHAAKADSADLEVYLFCGGRKDKLNRIEDLKASEGGGLLYEYLLKEIRTRALADGSKSDNFEEQREEQKEEQKQKYQPIDITTTLELDLKRRLEQKIQENITDVDNMNAYSKPLLSVGGEINALRKNNFISGLLNIPVKKFKEVFVGNNSPLSEIDFNVIKESAATIADNAYKKYTESIKADGESLHNDNTTKYEKIKKKLEAWSLQSGQEDKSKGDLLGLVMALNYFVSPTKRKILRRPQFMALCLQLAGLETARMGTGSGKTLVFTLAAIINAKLDKQVSLSTSNKPNFDQAISEGLFLYFASSLSITAIRPDCQNTNANCSQVVIGRYQDVKIHGLLNPYPGKKLSLQDECDAPENSLRVEFVKECPFTLSTQQWTDFFKEASKLENARQARTHLENFKHTYKVGDHKDFEGFANSFIRSFIQWKTHKLYYVTDGNQVKPLGPCGEYMGVFPGMITQFLQANDRLLVTPPTLCVLESNSECVLESNSDKDHKFFRLSATSGAEVDKKPVNLTKHKSLEKKRELSPPKIVMNNPKYYIKDVARELMTNIRKSSILVVVTDKEDADMLAKELSEKHNKICEIITGAAVVQNSLDTSRASEQGAITIATMDQIRSLDLAPSILQVIVCANKELFSENLPALFEQIEGRKRSNVNGYVTWVYCKDDERTNKEKHFIKRYIKLSKALHQSGKGSHMVGNHNAALVKSYEEIKSKIEVLTCKLDSLVLNEAPNQPVLMADSNKGQGWFSSFGEGLHRIASRIAGSNYGQGWFGSHDNGLSSASFLEEGSSDSKERGQLSANDIREQIILHKKNMLSIYEDLTPLNTSQVAQKSNKKWWILGTLLAFVAAVLAVYFTHSFNLIKSGIGKAWQWIQANTFKAVCAIIITLVLVAIVVTVCTNRQQPVRDKVKQETPDQSNIRYESLTPAMFVVDGSDCDFS